MRNVVDLVRAIREKLKMATSTILTEVAGVRTRITALRRAIDEAEQAPISIDEARTRAKALVQQTGAAWLPDVGRFLVYGENSLCMPLCRSTPQLPPQWNDAWWPSLCVLDPAGAVRLVMAAVESVSYAAGPPMAERPVLLSRLRAELAELEKLEEGLIDDAEEAGVHVQHRAEVVARRGDDARRAELEAQRVADRGRRQDALNAEHGQRRSREVTLDANGVPVSRVGTSAYLSRG